MTNRVELDDSPNDALLAPERRELLNPDRVISLIPLRPYHIVADVGCGAGYFAVPLAKYVNQGKLYALDTQEEMLEACRKHLTSVHLTNVEVLQCGQDKLPLDSDSLDGVFMAFVLHETSYKADLLAEAHRLLQRGGWVAVLEWYRKAMDEGPALEDRVSEEEARELGEKAGLRFVSRRDLTGKTYLMLFRK